MFFGTMADVTTSRDRFDEPTHIHSHSNPSLSGQAKLQLDDTHPADPSLTKLIGLSHRASALLDDDIRLGSQRTKWSLDATPFYVMEATNWPWECRR